MDIPQPLLRNLISAAEEVFETMVFKPLTSGAPVEGEAIKPKSNVVATVAFAGYRCGLVSIHSTTQTANVIAGAMLGQEPESINGEMPDAIGEIANMVAGTFRTKMATIEPACAISVPTVTMGSDFSTRYLSDVKRVICPFDMEGHDIFVELILTGQAGG